MKLDCEDFFKYCFKIPSVPRILDVGCGGFILRGRASSFNYSVTGGASVDATDFFSDLNL
jgi:2-polyprenyl-3-methyl-5-hydroxy-6-metoxy-1,4-benzoquinol methylase